MDGFDTNTNVIVIAATNRPTCSTPRCCGPAASTARSSCPRRTSTAARPILEVHAKGKPLDKDVELERLAKQTPGFSGADLAEPDQRGRHPGRAPQQEDDRHARDARRRSTA